MRLSGAEMRAVLGELTVSISVGTIAAFFVPAEALARIDEMLVTFLSIVLAAVIPGVALTAAAPRPAIESPLEARKLGSDLEGQVRFWFGFLLIGGLSVLTILTSSALGWKLPTPRPNFIPGWIPAGSAWLVFASLASITFTVVRARHVANAIIDLIRLGTEAHAGQALERRRQIQAEVGETLRQVPPVGERGGSLGDRERRPRTPPN